MSAGDDRRLALRAAVVSQIDWWWHALFRPRIEGLTDDELGWRPAPSTWSFEPNADGVLKYEWPPGSLGEAEPPVTTIAWRMCHMSCSGLASWTSALVGGSRLDGFDVPFPSAASEAVAVLENWFLQWRSAVDDLSDEDLWRPMRGTEFDVGLEHMRLGSDDPFVNYLLHQQRELIHHGAEISLLRDIYRATFRLGPDRSYLTDTPNVDRVVIARAHIGA